MKILPLRLNVGTAKYLWEKYGGNQQGEVYAEFVYGGDRKVLEFGRCESSNVWRSDWKDVQGMKYELRKLEKKQGM